MVILASTAPHMEFPLPGYKYVELRVAFKEDLHPFYPPTIAVLRPQLYGRCLATATHKDFVTLIYIYIHIYLCRNVAHNGPTVRHVGKPC